MGAVSIVSDGCDLVTSETQIWPAGVWEGPEVWDASLHSPAFLAAVVRPRYAAARFQAATDVPIEVQVPSSPLGDSAFYSMLGVGHGILFFAN